jgi:serine/threonine-protein phosphatase 2A regulatory subunit B'
MTQYVAKDQSLAEPIVHALLRYWPKFNSAKEVMFLLELQEIFDVLEPESFALIKIPFARQWCKCLNSKHFQVAERALCFLQDESILKLVEDELDDLMPLLTRALLKMTHGHWHRHIQTMTHQGLQLLMQLNKDLFVQCTEHLHQTEEHKHRDKRALWAQLESMAKRNPLSKVVKMNDVKAPRYSVGSEDDLEDDVLGSLSKFQVEDAPEPVAMRRRSFLPTDATVQAALASHHVHSVGRLDQ